MNFKDLLAQNELKATPQRLLITEKIYEKGHISIEDLFSTLKNIFPTISLATIYKNINTMVEKSIIEEVKLPNQKNMYELKKQSHSHTICKQCNKVCDIFVSMDTLQQQIDSLSDFDIADSSIVFVGVCKECKS